MRHCKYCGTDKPVNGFRGARCADCEKARHSTRTPEQRAEERRRAALKAGKVYVQGGREARRKFDAKSKLHDSHISIYLKEKAKAEKRAALLAEKPWNAEGLTAAEKFAIRYKHDPEFRRRNVKKVAAYKRKKLLDRFDGNVDAMNDYLRRWNQPPLTEAERRERARLYEKLRDKRIRQATPPWADRKEIMEIYRQMRAMRSQGMDVHVDHIIPLNGELVSGLHVPSNLRIMDAAANVAKGNSFDEEALNFFGSFPRGDGLRAQGGPGFSFVSAPAFLFRFSFEP